MPDRDSYAPGTPTWMDVASPDADASADFYGSLFGWTTTEAGPVEETGGYRMFQLRDRNVAGLGMVQEGGAPPSWTTYFATDDADATVARITANGGMVFAPPMDVMTAGRMVIAADPTGAAFGLWQAGDHHGAQIHDEPGSFCWNELNTRDTAGATAFYEAVFGWTHLDQEMDHPGQYTIFSLDGTEVAGMMTMPPEVPAEVPANWITYFAVDDVDATLTEAVRLGGSVVVPGTDIPPGRFGIATDQFGAMFAVMRMTAPL